MTPEQQQHFDELILKAVQSGKKETSGLVDTIMHKMETHIEDAINKNVNGKIKKLDEKIDLYIASDEAWKATAKPVIEMGKNVAGFGKVSLYIVGFVASVAGAILVVFKLFQRE